jgi:ABC-2 type transport system ATP-binding protein
MIRIHQVGKKFNNTDVLRSVSLRLEVGERVALIGHNGSGKTTLIRCLLGLYNHEGSISIDGAAPRDTREKVLAAVGFVPQTPPALRMTVGEFVTMTSELCGCSPKAIVECAAALGFDVPGLRKRPFRLLSGGMKQKLLIAGAIARKPKVLLMDEPAASLDPVARANFFALLSELPRETIMILSSHRVDELAGIVTRLVELDGGRIVLDDVVAAGAHETLSRRFQCRLQLGEANETIVAGLREWGLDAGTQAGAWEGFIAAPDRFRFLATLTRWSGMIDSLKLEAEL